MKKRSILVSAEQPYVFNTDMETISAGSLHFVNTSLAAVEIKIYEGNLELGSDFDPATAVSNLLETTAVAPGDAHIVKYLNNPVQYLSTYITTASADPIELFCYEFVRR